MPAYVTYLGLLHYYCKFPFLCCPRTLTLSFTTISYFLPVLPFQQSFLNFIFDTISSSCHFCHLFLRFITHSVSLPNSVPIHLCLHFLDTSSELIPVSLNVKRRNKIIGRIWLKMANSRVKSGIEYDVGRLNCGSRVVFSSDNSQSISQTCQSVCSMINHFAWSDFWRRLIKSIILFA